MALNVIKIGSRKSPLALFQSSLVKDYLVKQNSDLEVLIVPIDTVGDKTQFSGQALPAIGGKGLFTQELEEALRAREIDLAVHSLKDLPTEPSSEFLIAAISKRESFFDVLVSKENLSFDSLPSGAVLGTSSLRRSSQLKRLRPDLVFRHIRGNVETRINKVRDLQSPYIATVLAHAGLVRLNKTQEISYIFNENEILPAPGQGALAVQVRVDGTRIVEILKEFHDPLSAAEVLAERAFLARLMAGCSTPVAALAVAESGMLKIRGRCLSEDGKSCIEVVADGSIDRAEDLGRQLAEHALEKGAEKLLQGA